MANTTGSGTSRSRGSRRGEQLAEAASPRRAPARARAFVIQKHAATRLHYDFRLELEGVLKSWSVPKGPSLDPKDKRLAMRTEDHPIDYADVRGHHPQGAVRRRDRAALGPRDVGAAGADPHQEFAAGNLKFLLKGEKLRGGFALVESSRAGRAAATATTSGAGCSSRRRTPRRATRRPAS